MPHRFFFFAQQIHSEDADWLDVDKELEEVERDVADMVFNDLVTELAMEWMYALEYEERMDAKRAEQQQASASSQAP